ncbi:protein YgfX [Pseudomonas sp. GZD-222]|uniref:protein YgfX n=1 Tax=Pseudomonas sp. GZD-222 TaxID=3404805 RepID=UPI003BB5AA5D
MSSPSERFECRWQGSRSLLAAYLVSLLLALLALSLLQLPWWLRVAGVVLCLLHAGWMIPRRILLSHPQAVSGLRRDRDGWHLFSRAQGWQKVQLRPDSLALPGLVVLRYRRQGWYCNQGLCIAHDALEPVQHRRLRVRLKFSRRRWAAAE